MIGRNYPISFYQYLLIPKEVNHAGTCINNEVNGTAIKQFFERKPIEIKPIILRDIDYFVRHFSFYIEGQAREGPTSYNDKKSRH
jgi:hypothetical protein